MPSLPAHGLPFDPPGRTLAGRRVLFVLGDLELGGAERQALLLARHLAAERGAVVSVWGLGPAGRAVSICEEAGIPWRSIPIRWHGGRVARGASLASLALRLRKAAPDVILPYTAIPNVACGVASAWSRAGLSLWNQRDEGLGHPIGTLERMAARRTRVFVANSTGGARFLTSSLGVPAERIRIVANGVEHGRPVQDRAAWRSRLGVGSSAFLACMIANLHDNKDHETLFRAWRAAIDRGAGRRGTPAVESGVASGGEAFPGGNAEPGGGKAAAARPLTLSGRQVTAPGAAPQRTGDFDLGSPFAGQGAPASAAESEGGSGLGPDPTLLFAGRHGNTFERLQALARDLDLGDRVRFLGPVDDVAGLLEACDLAVLSSRSEGCPNGVLEPMAAGLPVAGTDIPGIREALGPEGGTLLAPPGDAAALADRILAAASDPDLRARLGASNRRRAGEMFSPRRMCEAMTAILVEALAGPGRG